MTTGMTLPLMTKKKIMNKNLISTINPKSQFHKFHTYEKRFVLREASDVFSYFHSLKKTFRKCHIHNFAWCAFSFVVSTHVYVKMLSHKIHICNCLFLNALLNYLHRDNNVSNQNRNFTFKKINFQKNHKVFCNNKYKLLWFG